MAELPPPSPHTGRGFFLQAMQKLYNLLGVLGFVISSTMAVGGVVAYTRIPSLTKKYVSELKLELTETILDQVPVPEIPKMPQLPAETGPAIPSIN